MIQFHINPPLVFKRLFQIFVVLLVANGMGLVIKHSEPDKVAQGIYELFDFDIEANFPSMFNTLLLLLSGLLLMYIYQYWHRVRGRSARRWFLLAIIFYFLAADELISFHESIMHVMRFFIQTEGYLYFAWVIPYGIGLIALGIMYIRFFQRLPRVTRKGIILSAILYVGGALGVEMLGAQAVSEYGFQSVQFSALYSLEESLEMIGLICFIYVLLEYIADLREGEAFCFRIGIRKGP